MQQQGPSLSGTVCNCLIPRGRDELEEVPIFHPFHPSEKSVADDSLQHMWHAMCH